MKNIEHNKFSKIDNFRWVNSDFINRRIDHKMSSCSGRLQGILNKINFCLVYKE